MPNQPDCPNTWVAEDPKQPGTVFAVCDADPRFAADAASETADWKSRFGVDARLMNKDDARRLLAKWEREKSGLRPLAH